MKKKNRQLRRKKETYETGTRRARVEESLTVGAKVPCLAVASVPACPVYTRRTVLARRGCARVEERLTVGAKVPGLAVARVSARRVHTCRTILARRGCAGIEESLTGRSEEARGAGTREARSEIATRASILPM